MNILSGSDKVAFCDELLSVEVYFTQLWQAIFSQSYLGEQSYMSHFAH